MWARPGWSAHPAQETWHVVGLQRTEWNPQVMSHQQLGMGHVCLAPLLGVPSCLQTRQHLSHNKMGRQEQQPPQGQLSSVLVHARCAARIQESGFLWLQPL